MRLYHSGKKFTTEKWLYESETVFSLVENLYTCRENRNIAPLPHCALYQNLKNCNFVVIVNELQRTIIVQLLNKIFNIENYFNYKVFVYPPVPIIIKYL